MILKRLAIITTHPIQYNAPLFKAMNEEHCSFTIKVFYTWSQSREKVFDRAFDRSISWDIPLLQGYDYTFVENISPNPGSHHFKGIVNPTLNREIEAWKADAVLVFGWSFSSHLKAIRHFHKKIPVLFRGDSTLMDEPASAAVKKVIRRVFLRWVYHYIDYALYVGAANKKYFLAHGLKPKQLLFAPHAIDNKRFSGNSADYALKAKNWRSELGIEETDIVFLFAAKLSTKKDPELLMKAFLALNKPKTKLVIVGNGELENYLKEKYASNRSIFFVNFQNQAIMPVVYRLADVFVLPSKGPGETWGLAVNEAMACSRAVIVSDKCGGSTDLIENGKNGYVFKHGNVESLTQCMSSSLDNFARQGKNSAEMIKKWSYAETIRCLNELFTKQII